MKKFLKWTGIILLILILAGIGGFFYLTSKADKMMKQSFSVKPPLFEIPTDSLSIANGKVLANLCTDCHGTKFEGKAFFDDEKLGRMFASNITKGKGSKVLNFTDQDWILALRHGVRSNGEGLMVMPAKDYNKMSQKDISSIIAYMKTVDPVDNETGTNFLTSFGKVLLAMGAFGELHSASTIDHSKMPPEAIEESTSELYGKYMLDISGCKSCHGEALKGGKHPDPSAPLVPDISGSGNIAKWTKTQFSDCMKTGNTPEGKHLNAKYMPYPAYAALNDTQMEALYNYLTKLK